MFDQIKRKLYNRLQLKVFQGNEVYCPCCNGHFITFLPGGATRRRPHAKCPQCGALERHRLLWYFITEKTKLLSQPGRLLHIAPEELFFKKFASNTNIEYVPGAKFGEGYYDTYPAGTQDMDITNLTLGDNSFDSIICSHVLEHIPDDRKAMQELYRVLKPSGWAILQVPLDTSLKHTYEDFSITDPHEREKAFGQYDHVRQYGKDYETRLRDSGFTVKRNSFAYNLPHEDRFRLGIIPEDIFYCTKQ